MKKVYSFMMLLCMVIPFSSSASFINFDDYTPQGFNSQMVSGTATTNGAELLLSGNLWVYLDGTFDITADTIMYFTMEGFGLNPEIFGVGFDNDNIVTPQTLFQTGGTENTRANQVGDYSVGDGAVDFAINVGDFFTGTFSQLIFILDNDSMSSGSEVLFSNVEFCTNDSACLTTGSNLNSANAVNAPSVALLSLFALFFTIRKRRSL